ncbi:MAG: DUF1028 domain-containing protein [Acidobacteria bacterium]|nr:DUF1028 domain-containing protein [Acidobacteriota bacterium]
MGIVAYDPKTGELGVACASRVFAAGQYMAHVRAGVGAVALMGGAPYKDAEMILDWMQQGASPEEVVARLRQQYPNPGQMSIVDARGRSIAITNPDSSDWKGHRIGTNYATSGNILAGPAVVDGFADTFERTANSDLPLAERLMMALEAADRAGGDARGRQGAIIKVYKTGAGPFTTDAYLDLRIDDSPNAIEDLRHLYERWKSERAQLYGSRLILRTEGEDVRRLQTWLKELGYLRREFQPNGIFNDATVEAVVAFKRDHQLGAGASVGREAVIKMIALLQKRLTSFWGEPSSMSIAGYDPATGEVGIAMASRFFAVAPIAVHVRANVGAVATMGGSPYKDAEEMLDWLEQGASPEEVVARLRQRYPANIGQMNIVDVKGRSISTTGLERMWKGHSFGRNFATSGNILAGPEVVAAFASTFQQTEGKGIPLAERLLAALEAADRAGGDARGQMGATLVVKKKRPGGVGPQNTDDYVNLRVDDSTSAIRDLKNLYYRWRSIRNQEPGFRIMEQSRGNDVRWVQESLATLGYLPRTEQPSAVLDVATVQGLSRFKRDHGLGGGASVGLEVINVLLRELNGRMYQTTGPNDTDYMIIYERHGGDLPKKPRRQ